MVDEKSKAVREACIASAESFLSVAERDLGDGAEHIRFHLALLALEEVGKSVLATISHSDDRLDRSTSSQASAIDDHVKKIFWAIWGPGMMRESKFTRESIEQNTNLATHLHGRRLASLYTDVTNPRAPEDRLDDGEAEQLVQFARARLEMEKAYEPQELEGADLEVLNWFLAATEDLEKRKYIFGRESLDRFAEFQNSREWMEWLRDVFQTHEAEMKALAEKEIRRSEPGAGEKQKPKYRMKIRIQTPSHAVRNNAFVEWNAGINDIKLFKSDKKDAKKLIKGEVLIEFIFPMAVPPVALWEHGFIMSKMMITALNIGTLGVFWWHVRKDVETFYEEIQDLEADPKGSVKFGVAPQKRLHVNFDEERLVLDSKAMGKVNLVAGFLLPNADSLTEFLRRYALGLTLFSKTDIHLRLEANAFEEFYNALKCAMKALGDWNESGNFKECVTEQYKEIGNTQELNRILDLAAELDADERKEKAHGEITLTEVIAMKMYCDVYILRKAHEYFKEVNQKRKKS